jgi:hypothetical protein
LCCTPQVRDGNDRRGVGEAMLRGGDGSHALNHMNLVGKHNIEQYETVTVRPTTTTMAMPATPATVKKQTTFQKMGDLFGISNRRGGEVRQHSFIDDISSCDLSCSSSAGTFAVPASRRFNTTHDIGMKVKKSSRKVNIYVVSIHACSLSLFVVFIFIGVICF